MQTEEQMVPSKKIKKLTAEQSAKFKACHSCGGQAFFEIKGDV